MKKLFYTLLLFSPCYTFGQANIMDSVIHTSIAAFSYSYQFPGGDLSKRFVSNNSIGGSYLYKTKKR